MAPPRPVPPKRTAPPQAPKAVVLASPAFGPKNPKVRVVEFSDFECPYCSQAANVINQLKKAYTGKPVRFVFKHLPLSFHPNAHLAAQASMAAHAQGKFWEYHDKLFANQEKLKKADLLDHAKQLKLDVAKFTKDLESGKYKERVDADIALAQKAGAQGTPIFFVNNYKVEGAYPFEHFKGIIDALLAGKKPPSAQAPTPPAPDKPVAIDLGTSPSLGPKNAKITIVEFSEFECPYCLQVQESIANIKKAYGDKVRIVFKHMPLSFHKDAHLAAQASLAAHAQGKFWEYHDKLFGNQEKLKKADLLSYAKQLKLDVAKFTKDLESGKYKAAVDADLAQAQKAGAQGTPTFFVNGYKVEGAQPFSRFKEVIDALLAGKPFPAEQQQQQQQQQAPSKPSEPVKIDLGNAVSIGPKDAKVTVVEFSDYQCPFCARGSVSVEYILKTYKDKVRVVFKNMPLGFHKEAHLAAQASLAAHAQGKFQEYREKLFVDQEKLKKADLLNYAKQLKLDVAKFTKDLESGKYKAQVDADLAQAQKVGVDGTPTFFVNGYKVEGAQPPARFKEVIDALLAGKPFPAEQQQQQQQAPSKPKGPVQIDLGNAPSVGPTDALITVVEFSDFECPYCSQAANVINQLKKEFSGKPVKFVFKQLPLSFHPNAHLAAQASLAAHAQGKFWEYHDKLFGNQEKLKKADLLSYAKQLKLDVAKFTKDLESGKYKAAVDADLAQAQKVGVDGTPTFYINGRELSGALPFEQFKQLLGNLLKQLQEKAKAPAPRAQ